MAGSEIAFPPALPPARRSQAALTRVTRASGRLQPPPRARPSRPPEPLGVVSSPNGLAGLATPASLSGCVVRKVSSLPSPIQSLQMPPSGSRCWGLGAPARAPVPCRGAGSLRSRVEAPGESLPERKRRVKPPAPRTLSKLAGPAAPGARALRTLHLRVRCQPRGSQIRALFFSGEQ